MGLICWVGTSGSSRFAEDSSLSILSILALSNTLPPMDRLWRRSGWSRPDMRAFQSDSTALRLGRLLLGSSSYVEPLLVTLPNFGLNSGDIFRRIGASCICGLSARGFCAL